MITGHTRFVPLLAHPSTHVRTPGVFNGGCAARQVDMVMVPLDVPPMALTDVVGSLRKVRNLAGFVVTIPHKTAIAELCDRLVGAAAMVGACNVVRKDPDGSLTGAMFDGEGFVAGLRYQGHDPAGRRVLLIGAGGAASGVAHALLGAGVLRLKILNRSLEKAAQLRDLLQLEFPKAEVVLFDGNTADCDMVVNGTSLGMKAEDPLPIPVDHIPSGALVAEVVMQPDITPLLAAALARNLPVHKGIHMVEQQVRLLMDFLDAYHP